MWFTWGEYLISNPFDNLYPLLSQGTEQEEGIFIVRRGKCAVVHDLPLHDHSLELEKGKFHFQLLNHNI